MWQYDQACRDALDANRGRGGAGDWAVETNEELTGGFSRALPEGRRPVFARRTSPTDKLPGKTGSATSQLEDISMTAPEWLKPGLFGAAAGAVALAIVGFSWGGWVTGGAAESMASDRAKVEVVAAMVPFCVARSRADPAFSATFAELKDAQTYHRRDILMEAGWATMPGSTEPDRYLATACLDALAVDS
jgi:hypothetical protein